MVRLACELADADAASLYVVEGTTLRPYIIYNLPKEYIEGIGVVAVGTQCCGRAVEHRRQWVVEDMLIDPLFADGRDGAVNSPIRSAFSTPVLDGEIAIASLACHFAKPHSPSKLDLERNYVFAKLIAISLRGRTPESIYQPVFVPTLAG